MVISFAPWLVLKILTSIPFSDPLTRLKTAIVIAMLICLYQSRKAVKGFIFWGSIGFFSFSFVTVVLMTNMWIIGHLGLLSQLTMCAIAWGSILFRRPFTLDYAKQYIPQEYWTNPLFLRKNYIITGVWGCYFLLGVAINEIRIYEPQISHLLLEVVDIASMIAIILFTSHASKRRGASSESSGDGQDAPAAD
jgi:hypothetical protein